MTASRADGRHHDSHSDPGHTPRGSELTRGIVGVNRTGMPRTGPQRCLHGARRGEELDRAMTKGNRNSPICCAVRKVQQAHSNPTFSFCEGCPVGNPSFGRRPGRCFGRRPCPGGRNSGRTIASLPLCHVEVPRGTISEPGQWIKGSTESGTHYLRGVPGRFKCRLQSYCIFSIVRGSFAVVRPGNLSTSWKR